AKNQEGYSNLSSILSHYLTNGLYKKKPRIYKKYLEKNRSNILIGSGCCEGDVFISALNENKESLKKKISFYDYIEVQPPSAYKHIIYQLGTNGTHIIEETILKIITECKKQNKLIIASSNAHYLNYNDKIYREIYINAKLIGGGINKLSYFPKEHLPDNFLLTTQEMIDSFYFLDKKTVEEIVIYNTHILNNQID
ncbi:MAG: PHP domain-containing protein, partial [Candidatus Phytoplasma australasiaticum]|nr:PHP domain-containing protein [Candidatus Phytoplasma australasiaticum]